MSEEEERARERWLVWRRRLGFLSAIGTVIALVIVAIAMALAG